LLAKHGSAAPKSSSYTGKKPGGYRGGHTSGGYKGSNPRAGYKSGPRRPGTSSYTKGTSYAGKRATAVR
jgi:hypothetical protein